MKRLALAVLALALLAGCKGDPPYVSYAQRCANNGGKWQVVDLPDLQGDNYVAACVGGHPGTK